MALVSQMASAGGRGMPTPPPQGTPPRTMPAQPAAQPASTNPAPTGYASAGAGTNSGAGAGSYVNGTWQASQPAAAPSSGGGGGGDAISALNAAYEAQTKQAQTSAGEEWQRALGGQGLGKNDGRAQMLRADVQNRLQAPIDASHQTALAGAYQAQNQLSAQQAMQQAQIQAQMQIANQSAGLQQQQISSESAARAAQTQLQQQQMSQQATQFDWQKQQQQLAQQWAQQDRAAQQDILNKQKTMNPNGYYGLPSPPSGGTNIPGNQQVQSGAVGGGGAAYAGTLHAGSAPGTDGLKADGSWQHPQSYNPGTGMPTTPSSAGVQGFSGFGMGVGATLPDDK